MYSGDRYKIIRLRKISHFIKQPCRNVCLEKALYVKASKLLKQYSTWLNKAENRIFRSTVSF